jgi:hypothetical protein
MALFYPHYWLYHITIMTIPKKNTGLGLGRVTTSRSRHESGNLGAWMLSREWMAMGVAGMIITSDYGSFPKIPC